MRRALRPQLPALSRLYGLKWADIENMPPAELWEYLEDLDAFVRARQQGR